MAFQIRIKRTLSPNKYSQTAFRSVYIYIGTCMYVAVVKFSLVQRLRFLIAHDVNSTAIQALIMVHVVFAQLICKCKQKEKNVLIRFRPYFQVLIERKTVNASKEFRYTFEEIW